MPDKRMAFWHDALLPHLIASLGHALPQFLKYGLRSKWPKTRITVHKTTITASRTINNSIRFNIGILFNDRQHR
jgi:hypothetical protein